MNVNRGLWKKMIALIMTGSLVCIITACGAATQPAGRADGMVQASAQNDGTSSGDESEGRVTVTANSSVYAVPDIVSMDFGVQTQHATAEGAQEANTDKTNAIIEALRSMEVEEDSIKTSGFDMYPRYSNGGQIIGYQVHTTLTVLDQPLDKAGDLISKAIASGATQVNGLSYSCSRYDEFYNEALAKAMEIAKGKAVTLSGAAEQELSVVREITEGYQDVTYRYNTAAVNAKYGAMMDAAEESGSMQILPGEAEIKAVVTVTYAMR